MSASREKRLRKEAQTGGPNLSAKKKQERQDAFRRAVAITVSAVVLFALVILIVSGSGIMQANMKALTIGDVPISGAEFDFHYFRQFYETYSMYEMYGMLEYLGLDPNRPFNRQSAFGGDETWAEYFEDEAVQALTVIVAQSEAAKREGIALTQEDLANIDDAVAAIEASAAQNGLKPDRLLRDSYGRGITLDSYRAILERAVLSDRYVTATLASYDRSDAELESYYEDNRERYDYIDYHTFKIGGFPPEPSESEEGYTDEELESYRAAQRERADEMLSRVTVSESFWALSREYTEEGDNSDDGDGGDDDSNDSDDDDDHDHEDETDGTLVEKYAVSSLGETTTAEFLLADGRKAGDKAVVEDGDDFIVLLFLKRYRDEEKTCDVRHLLVPFDDYGSAEEAEARAEELLRQWKEGAANEAYFAELANEFSTDGGSNTNGGLYENLNSSTSFVEPFKEWYLDPARRPGDTGIVETEYGYHIMFFSGQNDPVWKVNVRSAMDNEQYQEHREGLTEGLAYKRHWFGMVFTKSRT